LKRFSPGLHDKIILDFVKFYLPEFVICNAMVDVSVIDKKKQRLVLSFPLHAPQASFSCVC